MTNQGKKSWLNIPKTLLPLQPRVPPPAQLPPSAPQTNGFLEPKTHSGSHSRPRAAAPKLAKPPGAGETRRRHYVLNLSNKLQPGTYQTYHNYPVLTQIQEHRQMLQPRSIYNLQHLKSDSKCHPWQPCDPPSVGPPSVVPLGFLSNLHVPWPRVPSPHIGFNMPQIPREIPGFPGLWGTPK